MSWTAKELIEARAELAALQILAAKTGNFFFHSRHSLAQLIENRANELIQTGATE